MRFNIRSVFILIFILLPVNRAQSDDACGDIDHLSCFKSPKCIIDHKVTIDHGNGKRGSYEYICRSRRLPCETGLPDDAELRSTECKKRGGCSMQGRCYCPCDDQHHPEFKTCNCECGGGLPHDCRELVNNNPS